jgi:hypothetical protein
VRIAHLSPVRGLGCDLLVRGWAIRGSLRVDPYLAENARPFLDISAESPSFRPTHLHWDFENRSVVQARCAHYGLRDAARGTPIDSSRTATHGPAALRPASRDCGGPWQIYWRQSIPGSTIRAIAPDGTPHEELVAVSVLLMRVRHSGRAQGAVGRCRCDR